VAPTTRLCALVAALCLCVVPVYGQDPAPSTPTSIRHVALDTFVFVTFDDGRVVGWGREEYPLAAREPSAGGYVLKPMPIVLPAKVRQMATSARAAYALLEEGTVLAWGNNEAGLLGSGMKTVSGARRRNSATPLPVSGLKDIVDVAAGTKAAFAVRADGRVFAWGAVKMGTSTTWEVPQPAQVSGLENIVRVAAGGKHYLALDRNGRVWSWGESNQWGELGRDPGTDPWVPGVVEGLDGVVSIAAGGEGINASGAVRIDGSVWVWGGNQSGMMGNGTNPVLGEPGSVNPKPMPVKGVAGAKTIVMAMGHVAVLLRDGTLRLWGHDGYGQIGVGSSGGYQELPKKPALNDVVAVSLGRNRSAALRKDGSLWIWGASTYEGRGLFGTNQSKPVEVKLR
jgi:alpha-tubulin suppressor-like RCC1 family protein